MEIIFAVILGVLFGFVLQRIGAADPEKIIGMLRLTDLHLMKAILSGIGIASSFLFLGLMTSWIDAGHLSIKSMYWGVIVGGALLGFGWALAGYCPGTGIVAAGSGRVDAVFFVAGGLVGAGAYTMLYESLMGTWLFESLLGVGGKMTLAAPGSATVLVVGDSSQFIVVLSGLMMVVIAHVLPERIR